MDGCSGPRVFRLTSRNDPSTRHSHLSPWCLHLVHDGFASSPATTKRERAVSPSHTSSRHPADRIKITRSGNPTHPPFGRHHVDRKQGQAEHIHFRRRRLQFKQPVRVRLRGTWPWREGVTGGGSDVFGVDMSVMLVRLGCWMKAG